MSFVSAGVGVVVLVALFADVLRATLTLDGHGFISAHIARLASGGMRLLRRVVGARRALTMTGPAVLVSLFVTWFALLWLGWWLVFASGAGSVVVAATRAPADLLQTAYFVGMTVITLGTGDVVAANVGWQLLSVVAAVSGFFLVTMVITYLLPVLSAVVQARQLASTLHGMGDDVPALLARAWDARREAFVAFDDALVTATQKLRQVEKQHLAYPVLHDFLTPERRDTLALAVARLDDVVSVLLHVAPPPQRPPDSVLLPLRSALDDLLGTLRGAFIYPADDVPPPPSLPPHLQPHAPAWSDAEPALRDRRRTLLGWVRQSGHDWRA